MDTLSVYGTKTLQITLQETEYFEALSERTINKYSFPYIKNSNKKLKHFKRKLTVLNMKSTLLKV